MARKWSGFLPQNLSVKEEWDLVESCEHQARKTEQTTPPRVAPSVRDQKKDLLTRVLKPKPPVR